MEPRNLTSQALPLLERCPEDIPVYTAAPEVLTRLTGFHLTRGMLCAMRRPALPTVEEVCANARRIAVLENVMNPTNIGAIFRCDASLGMDAVLLTAAAIPCTGGLPVSVWAMCFSSHGRICRRRLRGQNGCGGWAFKRWPWPCGRTRCF